MKFIKTMKGVYTMYKKGDYVEGKGYFKSYLCENCGKDIDRHKSKSYACPKDLRKSFPTFSVDKFYQPNEKKPVFVKFIL